MQVCNEANTCAYWLVNETLWYETETRPRHLIFSPRRDRDRDLPTFSRDETETFGNYVSRPSRDRDVETETTSLPLRHSMSFKVTDFGTNRKLICDFLLVINSNLPRILHCFLDIAFNRFKIAIFCYPSWV